MPILTPIILISWEVPTPFSTSSKVRESVKMTRILRMVEVTLPGQRPLSRDLSRLMPNLANSRLTPGLAKLSPREKNPDIRLKKRKSLP